MSRKVRIQQHADAGLNFGKLPLAEEMMDMQRFAHRHVELVTRDALTGGSAGALVAGFDYQLPGGLQFSVGAGQALSTAGLSHETLPEGDATVLALGAAHVALPRVDLVYARLDADAPTDVQLRPFRRLRTQAELEAGVDPYPPSQYNLPTKEDTQAVVLVRQGVPDAAPAAPPAAAGEVALYHVRVNAGAVALNAGNVTDVRVKLRSLYQLGADVAALVGGNTLHETIDDRVNALLAVTPNSGLSKVYDDAANTLTLAGVAATQAAMGMMSAADKAKLDQLVMTGGKVDPSVLPAVAITNTFVVASEAAQLALVAQVGDVAIRSDLNDTFILRAEPANVLGNWQVILKPAGGVASFNGRVGAVALLLADVTGALGFTPVNKAGDTMTGQLQAPTLKVKGGDPGANFSLAVGIRLGANVGAGVEPIQTIKSTHNGNGNENNAIGFFTWKPADGTGNDGTVPGFYVENGRASSAGDFGVGTRNVTVSGAGSRLHVAGDTLRLDTPRGPAAGSAGNPGEVCWDANYVYVCVAANTWKRAALAAY